MRRLSEYNNPESTAADSIQRILHEQSLLLISGLLYSDSLLIPMSCSLGLSSHSDMLLTSTMLSFPSSLPCSFSSLACTYMIYIHTETCPSVQYTDIRTLGNSETCTVHVMEKDDTSLCNQYNNYVVM